MIYWLLYGYYTINIWLTLMVIVWFMMVKNNLIGGIPTPLKKYEFVSLDDYSQYIWKNKTCSKPPIRI